MDGLLFFAPAFLYLAWATASYSIDLSDAAIHLAWVLLAWTGALAARATWGAFGGTLAPDVGAIIAAAIWVVMAFIQGFAVVALQFWGNLPTRNMLAAYLQQLGPLAEVLGLASGLVDHASWLLLLPTGIVFLFLRRLRVSNVLPGPLWRRAGMALAFALCWIVSALAWFADPLVSRSEPVSVFLYPEQATKVWQSWGMTASPIRDAREEKVRERYGSVPLSAERRNVVVIVVDALRADRLPMYGNRRYSLPNMERRFSGWTSAVAPRFRSVCAESSCGLLAIPRSKYPWGLSVKDFSLYDALTASGYRTHFILAGDHTNFYGLRETYAPATSYWDGSERTNPRDTKHRRYVNDDRGVLEAAADLPLAGERPAYIQLHLMSVHGMALRLPEFNRFTPERSPYSLEAITMPGEETVRQVANFYDNGILQMDDTIGQFMALLEEKGYLDDAVVVLTGDHGELLGEFGELTHAKTVLEPVLSPPLVFWSSRKDDPDLEFAPHPITSQVDIAPTLLTLLDLPVPETWAGIPLQRAAGSRAVFFAQGSERGVYLERGGVLYKFVHEMSEGRSSLYRSDEGSSVDVPVSVEGRVVEIATEMHLMLEKEVGAGWTRVTDTY